MICVIAARTRRSLFSRLKSRSLHPLRSLFLSPRSRTFRSFFAMGTPIVPIAKKMLHDGTTLIRYGEKARGRPLALKRRLECQGSLRSL